jgi:hypothetical protein
MSQLVLLLQNASVFWTLARAWAKLLRLFVFWSLSLQLEPNCLVATKLVFVRASLVTAWANLLGCYKARFCSGLSRYSLSQLARLLQSTIVFWPLSFQREQTLGVASRRVCVLTYKGKLTSIAVTWYGSARSIFCHNLLSSIFKANKRGNE